MEIFETLFGIPASGVRETCVVMPAVRKELLRGFGVEKLFRGSLYAAGTGVGCTVIHGRMGAAFTGDAVLYLDSTPCRDVILFGACGLLDTDSELKIGSLTSPSCCYSQESFTELMTGYVHPRRVTVPDSGIHDGLIHSAGPATIADVTGLSIGSFKLQEENREIYLNEGIQVVDLECAAVFSAAAGIKKRAVALLVISDLVGEKPFYGELQRDKEDCLRSSLLGAVRIICEFIRENQNV